MIRLVERTGYPIAATLLGKSIVRESHPQYLGIYEGTMGREDVRKAVESADCVLILGAFMTDINLGIYTAQLEVSRSINAISAGVSIKHHINRDVKLKHFIDSPTKAKLGPKKKVKTARRSVPNPSKPRKDAALTVARFFDRMNHYLGERTMVISDIGDSL
ncbi:MAG: alpha-keto acid decarboxylase family protein, partial [Candidatus Hydrogenedentes bacterium]|nr:alpha-keto acid decarboxylase family protein [Candidatus Hydrogenedentota bacterium]